MSESVAQKKTSLKEDALKAQKCENLSDIVDANIVEPISMIFTKMFVKFNVHPNVVTLLSMFFGILGGVLFYWNRMLLNGIGMILEFIAVIFDASDGQVARITNKKSELGRLLDGVSDGLVYVSMYFFLSMRLMGEPIPFTDVNWGYWIWIVSAVCGLILHTGQARVADYYRNVHMYFKNNERGNDLTLSKQIKEEYNAISGKPLKKFGLKFYCFYTKLQERGTPKLQKLLNVIYEKGEGVPQDVSEDFTKQSKKIVRVTNLLTYNLRTIVLFTLIFFRQHAFIFPFILLVLEPIKLILVRKYEKIAKGVLQKYYN